MDYQHKAKILTWASTNVSDSRPCAICWNPVRKRGRKMPDTETWSPGRAWRVVSPRHSTVRLRGMFPTGTASLLNTKHGTKKPQFRHSPVTREFHKRSAHSVSSQTLLSTSKHSGNYTHYLLQYWNKLLFAYSECTCVFSMILTTKSDHLLEQHYEAVFM
jgi:hypothetical protein